MKGLCFGLSVFLVFFVYWVVYFEFLEVVLGVRGGSWFRFGVVFRFCFGYS